MVMMIGGYELVQEIFKSNDTYDMLQKAIQFFEFMHYKDKVGKFNIEPLLKELKQEDMGYPTGALPEHRLYYFDGDTEPMEIREPIRLLSKGNKPKDEYVCSWLRHKIITEAVKFIDRTEIEDEIETDEDEDEIDMEEEEFVSVEDMDKEIDKQFSSLKGD